VGAVAASSHGYRAEGENVPISVRVESSTGGGAVILESDLARVLIRPRAGGKVASLIDKTTGKDLFWRDQRETPDPPCYGDRWKRHDMSGWEDCLPTVAADTYPAWPWQGVALPEHGEVWALPWLTRVLPSAVEVSVHGVRLPYRFEKRISLDGALLRLHHRLSNPSAFPMHYVWAAHPLFQVRSGMRIVLPDGGRLYVDWSRDDHLGRYLDTISWPRTRDIHGDVRQLDRIDDASPGRADKLYLSPLTAGWCGLYDPDDGYAVALSFDVRRLPVLGVWINQGGWPLDREGDHTVALEPATGHPDLLHVAVARGTATTIGPGEEHTWDVALCFGHATSVPSLLHAYNLRDGRRMEGEGDQ